MIHFDFTVTDQEAETLFDCVRDEIAKSKYGYGRLFDDTQRVWHETRVIYLESLISKMKNSKIKLEIFGKTNEK